MPGVNNLAGHPFMNKQGRLQLLRSRKVAPERAAFVLFAILTLQKSHLQGIIIYQRQAMNLGK